MEKIKKFFLHWEWILVVLIVATFAFFSNKLGDSYTFVKLLDQTRVYIVDVGFMALGIMLILILGDIDISIGSTAALSVTVMAVAYKSGEGLPFSVSILLALLVGIVCGLFNGVLVTRFKELFPMIITLSTQTIYRGIAYIILKDQSAGGFPTWFSKRLGYGKVFDVIPIMLLCILLMFPIFYFIVHRTAFGRQLFAIGTNINAARYSGVRTDRLKVLIFAGSGLLAAIGGIFLTSRTGSVKYTIATGYEMQAIAVAVLGGASTSGGKGSVIGLLLSLILMTCLKNGLMIAYNDSFILNLSIGVLLIAVVLIPNITNAIRAREELKRRRQASAVQ